MLLCLLPSYAESRTKNTHRTSTGMWLVNNGSDLGMGWKWPISSSGTGEEPHPDRYYRTRHSPTLSVTELASWKTRQPIFNWPSGFVA